jgi:hypothetical protein
VADADVDALGLILGLSLIVGVGVGLEAIGYPKTFRVNLRPSQSHPIPGSDINSTVCNGSSEM